MNKKIMIAVGAIVIFGAGFLSGMEYKAYQIRDAFTSAFTDESSNETDATALNEEVIAEENTVMAQAEEEEMITVERNIGDKIELATLNFTVNEVEERETLPSTFGAPKVAKEGAKFLLVSMDVMNTTDSEFMLTPDFLLVDEQGREFSTYSDSIGSIDDYLDYRDLSPSITESGTFIYEIPEDSTQYYLVISKSGSKELYKIALQ